jgi:hypothetical protein
MMDIDYVIRQFDSIENKLEVLINTCQTLKAKNDDLENKMFRLEQELRVKGETEKSFVEERALIKSKIDKLLAKLEDFKTE